MDLEDIGAFVCPIHQLAVPIDFLRVICGICGHLWANLHAYNLFSRKNSITFTHEFRRHSGGVRKDFIEKGVIEVTNL